MKRLFYLAFAALLVVACNPNQEKTPEVKFSVNPSVITCPDKGGEYTVSLTALAAWTATCDASWVKVTPLSGEAGTSDVSIRINANKESIESSAKVVFTSGSETVELSIRRAPKEAPRLSVLSDMAFYTPKEGGTYTVIVESNIKWSISSNTGWAHVSKGVSRNNDNITVTVDAATIPEETVANITVAPYGEGKEAGEQIITITRGSTDATSLVLSTEVIDAPSNGGNYSVNVESNAKWYVYTSWENDWIHLNNVEGDGNGSFSVAIDPATSSNDITGVITVEEVTSYKYPAIVQVKVTRKGKEKASLSVEPASINAPAEGGEYAVEIKSNYGWTASSNANRTASVSTTKGDGDGTLVVTVHPAKDNDGDVSLAKITITSDYGGEKAYVNIRRAPKGYITLDIDGKYEVSYGGGEYTVNVASNTDWDVVVADSKIATANPTTGSGTGKFKLTVHPADNSENWSTMVYVKSKSGNVKADFLLFREGLPVVSYEFHPFTIGEDKQAWIAQGNLQYQPSTNTWRFALTQYHYCGDANRYIEDDSNEYTGWMDLFGWGTAFHPTRMRDVSSAYSPFADWGKNKISNGDSHGYTNITWRTPTAIEWEYIIGNRGSRQNKNLRGYATVNDVHGYVFLPDDWSLPSGVSFNAAATDYDTNKYDAKAWRSMEAAGAVFLPASGFRYVHQFQSEGKSASYWSSSLVTSSTTMAHCFFFSVPKMGQPVTESNLYEGHSVRLIHVYGE